MPPPNFNVALVDKRELMRYAALAEKLARSKKLPFATLKTGGEGGRRAGVCSGVSCSWETFGFPLFARGSFEVRSWLQKRCRCRGGLGGAKLQAAENQRKSVLVFARRVRRERVFCLVSVGVGASLRRWFAWASARFLRENWRWLKLARTQNRGRAAAPNLGPRFLLATKSGPAPRTCNWPRRKAQPEGLWCCCCLECLRATPLSVQQF